MSRYNDLSEDDTEATSDEKKVVAIISSLIRWGGFDMAWDCRSDEDQDEIFNDILEIVT